MLYLLIVGCEIGFWLVLLLSLVVRYQLRREGASRWLLRSLPAIDLLLLAFTALDLHSGTAATFAHGFAAVYVGFTVAFGAIAIQWADMHFAHRFAGGAVPPPAPTGWAAVRYELALWLRSIVAWIIALSLLELMIAVLADEAVKAPLRIWHQHALGAVFFWFVFGPLWSLIFFRRRATV